MLLWLLLIGGVFTLGLLALAFSGPNAAKALKRRVESVKERHGEMSGAIAQAQVRKMFGQGDSKLEGYASSLIPRPAFALAEHLADLCLRDRARHLAVALLDAFDAPLERLAGARAAERKD